jgi:hypothetical protein
MTLPSRREWLLLGLGLIVIVAWIAFDHGADETSPSGAQAPAVIKPKAQAPRSADPNALDLSARQGASDAGESTNLFAGKSWYVPPPPAPAAKPLPAPPPTAPPLPFSYLGRYQDSGAPIIYLVRGERVLLVSAGDVIEGTYRVDGIVANRLSLTYLPLNIGQTLEMGNVQ